MSKPKTSLVGFFAYAYPEQKCKERIDNARKALEEAGIEVNFCGYFTDHDEDSQKKAKELLDKTAFDSTSLTLVVSAWCESPPVFRVIADHMHLPVLMWSLAAYRTEAGLVAPAAAACASGLNLSLKMFGARHYSLYDIIDKGMNVEEAAGFLKLADSLHNLKNTRVASVGYADMNLYSLMYDGTLIKKYTGIHVDNLDLIDLKNRMDEVKDEEIKGFISDYRKSVEFLNEPTPRDLEILARSYIGINRIIEEKGYKAITLKCVLGMSSLMNFSPCMLESMIGDKVDTICECDVMGMITQVIIKELTGNKAVFQEFYEFYENSMLVGACGFSPFSVCDEKCIKIQGHDWGDSGGIMNVSKLKTGKITFMRFYTVNGQMHCHLVTGNAKKPERWQEDGWDGKGPEMPSLEITLDSDIEDFKENVSGQHYIVAYGDISKIIKTYCKFTGIRFNGHNMIDFNYR